MQALPAVSNAEHVHNLLVSAVGETVKNYRNDLLVHDLKQIEQNGCKPFIVCATGNGTHYYSVDYQYSADAIPVAFSTQPHYLAARNFYHCFAVSHRPNDTFAHWDGSIMRKISFDDALFVLIDAIRLADARMIVAARLPGEREIFANNIRKANEQYNVNP